MKKQVIMSVLLLGALLCANAVFADSSSASNSQVQTNQNQPADPNVSQSQNNDYSLRQGQQVELMGEDCAKVQGKMVGIGCKQSDKNSN